MDDCSECGAPAVPLDARLVTIAHRAGCAAYCDVVRRRWADPDDRLPETPAPRPFHSRRATHAEQRIHRAAARMRRRGQPVPSW